MSKSNRLSCVALALVASVVACGRSNAQIPADEAVDTAGTATTAKTVTWQHALGATLQVPADWQQVARGGSTTFVPPDAKRADGKLRELCTFVFLPAGEVEDVHAPELVAGADAQMANLADRVERVGEVERVATADGEGLALHYDIESRGEGGRLDLHVTLHVGFAIGLLAMGEPARLAQDAEVVRGMFRSLRFGAELHEKWLARPWTRGEAYSSSGFSMATQTTLRLAADGRFVRRSEAAGGDDSSCFESDGGGARGRWYGGNGALVLRYDDGSFVAWTCKLVDGTLVLYDANQRRTLWN